MDERKLEIVLRARDEASKTLRQVGEEANSLSSIFKNNYKEAALMATGVVVGLAAMTKSAVLNAASYEQNRIAFESMLGSADKARNLLQEVSNFARKTPFDLPQVVEGTRRLLAYGIAQKDVIPTFRQLGDIASAVGTDKLPQLILAYGQVRAATKLTGMELRQFSEAGVPLLGTLATHFKTTTAEVQQMVSDGQVGFADVQAAMAMMTGQGGIFFQGMERQASSFNGIMSNLNDSFGRFVRQVVGISEQGDVREGSIFYYVRLGAERLLPVMEQLGPKVAEFIDLLLQNKAILIAMAGAITALLILAIGALVVTFGSAIAVMLAFAAAGAAIAVGIAGLIQMFQDFGPIVAAKMEQVRQAFMEKVNALPKIVRQALDLILNMVANFFPVIRIGLDLPDIVGAFNGLKNRARGMGIPGFAEGTNFAPGGLAWVGERGPELVHLPRGSQVIPNDRSQQMMGSGVHIDQVVIRQDSDIETLARRLDFYRRTGGSR